MGEWAIINQIGFIKGGRGNSKRAIYWRQKFKRIYNEESGFPALVEMINGVEVDLEYRDLNITNRFI